MAVLPRPLWRSVPFRSRIRSGGGEGGPPLRSLYFSCAILRYASDGAGSKGAEPVVIDRVIARWPCGNRGGPAKPRGSAVLLICPGVPEEPAEELAREPRYNWADGSGSSFQSLVKGLWLFRTGRLAFFLLTVAWPGCCGPDCDCGSRSCRATTTGFRLDVAAPIRFPSPPSGPYHSGSSFGVPRSECSKGYDISTSVHGKSESGRKVRRSARIE